MRSPKTTTTQTRRQLHSSAPCLAKLPACGAFVVGIGLIYGLLLMSLLALCMTGAFAPICSL